MASFNSSSGANSFLSTKSNYRKQGHDQNSGRDRENRRGNPPHERIGRSVDSWYSDGLLIQILISLIQKRRRSKRPYLQSPMHICDRSDCCICARIHETADARSYALYHGSSWGRVHLHNEQVRLMSIRSSEP